MRAAALCPSFGYPYGGTAYANPDAVTQIANGLSTTTFTYDNNGNVTQKTVDGTTTTYVYDYANRLTALGVGGATTGQAIVCRRPVPQRLSSILSNGTRSRAQLAPVQSTRRQLITCSTVTARLRRSISRRQAGMPQAPPRLAIFTLTISARPTL